MDDPALLLDRARETWHQHGCSEKWILLRITGQEIRNKLTCYLTAIHLLSWDSLILRLVIDNTDDAVRRR